MVFRTYQPKPIRRKVVALLLAALMMFTAAAPAFADLFAFVTVGEEDKNVETAYGEGVLTAYTDEYDFRLEYFEDSKIPENTELYVSEIPEGSELYEKYLAAAEKTYAFTDKTVFARFFDICLINPETGEPVEPEGLVDVTIAGEEVASVDKVSVIHFPDNEKDAASDQKSDEQTEGTQTRGGTFSEEITFDDAKGTKGTKGAKGGSFDGKSADDGKKSVETVPDAEENNSRIEVIDVSKDGAAVRFCAGSFSVYGVFGTVIEKTVLGSDGYNYKITATYAADTGIPEDADLSVNEISVVSEAYSEYVAMTENALGIDEGSIGYIRLFDIKIVDRFDEDIVYQPADGTTVDVKIELIDADADDYSVVHFDAENNASVVDAETDGSTVSFAAGGFSVYAIVPGPSSNTTYTKVKSVDELTSVSGGFYIGHTTGYYLKNTTTTKSGRTYIQKTGQKDTPNVTTNATTTAVRYYFENAPDGKYYIYCYNSASEKVYVSNSGNNSISLTADASQKTAFSVEVNSFGVFSIHNGDWYLTMPGGSGGNGFAAVKSPDDSNNSLYIWRDREADEDPYGLDGMSYGLMTWTGGRTAKALMAKVNTGTDENDVPYSGCLEAKFLSVMVRETDASDKLYVPNNTADTVTHWTFILQDPSNHYYYLQADNGQYLKITSAGLELVDTPDNSCRIKVTPGTGDHKGQISLKAVGNGNKALTYSGKYVQGYGIGGVSGSEWLNLVTPLPEDVLPQYEKVYTATKVSVSDTVKVNTGSKIIIYARQWKNDHYEYYAINSKGELVPCNESGDTIEWYGGNLNDMLWQFTEYVWDDGVTPNGYYELESLYARGDGDPSYLAPQFSTNTVLFDHTVGVLLQGRTNQQYYTPIVAWDNPEYMYSGLTVDLNQPDPVLKPCFRADGIDFYFAIMDDVPVDDEIHTVPTIDNTQYGITMRMVDLSNSSQTSDLTGQMNAFLHNGIQNGKTWNHTPGLLSTNLTNDYPTTTDPLGGGSLSLLYDGNNPENVNHLFMESTYRATGYFEYNSAQNFAHLLKEGDALVGTPSPDGGTYAVGDFVVYKEIGTNDTTKKDTLQHGQFFPYNDIEPGRFASTNAENLYTVTADLLPDTDPRKHEQLYLVTQRAPDEKTDYFFAMELEASFVQTPSGLDAWGHDIIFEFSGDDDFWLYVDDELVIDLGGIHSAVSGSVNFRTGQVIVNPKSNQPQNLKYTTLYDLFISNYIARGATQAEATARADQLFELNEAGNHVFKDDTNHTMRIFYMERGAGASNLHMKFNLAAVKKGTAELTKKLEGVSSTGTTYALFPYQVYYTWEDDPYYTDEEVTAPTEYMLRNAFDPSEASSQYYSEFGTAESTDYVFYKDSSKPVTFLPELKVLVENDPDDPTDDTYVTYYNVFLLKPDETAVINFPVKMGTVTHVDEVTHEVVTVDEEMTVGEYRIVECGIDPTIYTEVKANDVVLTGVPNSDDPDLSDYGIERATTKDRPRVKYVNKVETLNDLRITKELYRDNNGSVTKIAVDEMDPDPLHEQKFNYRLYFKTPIDSDFQPAAYYVYHVKDPDGYYCRYNKQAETFERIKGSDMIGDPDAYLTGTKDFSKLTDDPTDVNGNPLYDGEGNKIHGGKFYASFETSPNGSIATIPAYYTVEALELIPGTQYMVVERPTATETPEGFKFYQYANEDDPTGASHTDPYDPWDGITGTISTAQNTDSEVYVRNYKGYALHLYKNWADASNMEDRDPADFAVYYETVDNEGNSVSTLVPGSVRELAYSDDPQELQWFYLNLPTDIEGVDSPVFSNFFVREVRLTGDGTTVGTDGVVSGYDTITPVANGGTIVLNGTMNTEGATEEAITYKVSYAQPETVGTNLRRFRVTNTPSDKPAVKILKKDWSDHPLAGAKFTLTQSTTTIFEDKTSAETTGLVSIEHLKENTDYVLKETSAPQGYYGLTQNLTFQLVTENSEWTLHVTPSTGSITDYYEVGFESVPDESGVTQDYVTLTIKDRPYDLQFVKEDSLSHEKLQGVKFTLHRRIQIGETIDWSAALAFEGETELITDENGVIPHLDNALPAGTYQLREVEAAAGFALIGSINFTIDQMGVITLGDHPDSVTLTSTIPESGDQKDKLVYTLTIPNQPLPLKLKKVDDFENPLTGAKFTLKVYNGSTWVAVNLQAVTATGGAVSVSPSTESESNEIDMTTITQVVMKDLPVGFYKLTESVVPTGYVMTGGDVYFKIQIEVDNGVSKRTVSLTDENGTALPANDIIKLTGPDSDGVYTIVVKNSNGLVLPSTGGSGIKYYTVIGLGLVASCAVVAWIRFRRREREI